MLGHDAALIDDDKAVAELFGFVHVVGGEKQRRALFLEAEQAVPENVAGLWDEFGGRLVEQQDARVVDEGTGDGQAPFHAAGEVVDLGCGLVLELGELEQFVGPASGSGTTSKLMPSTATKFLYLFR